jgi:hypothetical protein
VTAHAAATGTTHAVLPAGQAAFSPANPANSKTNQDTDASAIPTSAAFLGLAARTPESAVLLGMRSTMTRVQRRSMWIQSARLQFALLDPQVARAIAIASADACSTPSACTVVGVTTAEARRYLKQVQEVDQTLFELERALEARMYAVSCPSGAW